MQVLLPIYCIGIFGFGSFSGEKRKLFAYIYCLMLAIMAFTFIPHTADDLYREFENLKGIQQYGWEYFSMKENIYYGSSKFEGLYLAQLYYYIMAMLPSLHFLPAVTVFIVYFLQFSIIEKTSQRFQLNRMETFFLYMFVLSTRETYMIMSGIRNHLAFTIAGFLLYEDLIEKRNHLKCLIGYVAMIFIHQSSLFILLFRICILIKNRKIRYIIAIVLLFWSEFLDICNAFLEHYINIPIINSLVYKINIYTVNNGGNANNLVLRTRYLIYMLVWVPIILVVMVAVYQAMKYMNNNETGEFNILHNLRYIRLRQRACSVSENDIYEIGWFIIYNVCYTLGAIKYYWLYLRSAMILGIVGFIPSAILMYDFRNNEVSSHKKNNHLIFLTAMCMIKILVIMFYMNRNMDFIWGG